MRIVTHTDFDGIISAYLVCRHFEIEKPEVITVEPAEVQHGEIEFEKEDIVCDLPQPRDKNLEPIKVKLWFDHHLNTSLEMEQKGKYVPGEKSCAQVIHDYFEMKNDEKMLEEVNRIDSASFTPENINDETTGHLISMALRTRDDDLDFYFFKHVLERLIKKGYEDVLGRVIMFRARFKIDKMKESWPKIKKILQKMGDIAVLDMRSVMNSKYFDKFYPFVLAPDLKYLIRMQRGPKNTVRVGLSRNLFDKTDTNVSVQELMRMFGGGGHRDVGGFNSTQEEVDQDVEQLIFELKDALEEN